MIIVRLFTWAICIIYAVYMIGASIYAFKYWDVENKEAIDPYFEKIFGGVPLTVANISFMVILFLMLTLELL